MLAVYPSFAEDIYVSGVTKITMRTGAGVENKIIDILTTGDKLELLEYKRDWSLVKTDQGKTGWVLSRFLTQEVPDLYIVENLKKDNEDLILKLGTVEAENKVLAEKNKTFDEIKEKYDKLKQESAEFLKLEADYNKIREQFAAKKEQIEMLEKNLDKEQKLWFLTGAGVFVFGLLLGLVTRKKKRNSLL